MSDRARAYCLTINNWTQEQYDALVATECEYLIVGKEKGESGTPHLQVYIRFKSQKAFSKIKEDFPTAHIERAEGTPWQNKVYCSKGKDFLEIGKIPTEKNNTKKLNYDEALNLAKEGEFDKINPGIYIRHKRTLQEIYGEEQRKRGTGSNPGDQLERLRNEWIVGRPRIGKSRSARLENSSHFIKPCNKWWDGYLGEPVIIIDDFELDHKCLSHYLKIWADHYPFPAEVKGNTIKIRPAKIVVTSNYRIEDIWTDQQTILALQGRFQVRDFDQNPPNLTELILEAERQRELDKENIKPKSNNIVISDDEESDDDFL